MQTTLRITKQKHTAQDDDYTRNLMFQIPHGLKNINADHDYAVLFDWLIEREATWGLDATLISEAAELPFFADFVKQLNKMQIKPLGTTDGSTFGRVYQISDLKRAEIHLQPARRYKAWVK